MSMRWNGFEGQRLLETRQAQHLSQDQLAKRLGHVRNRISEWETGQRIPTPPSLRALADALRVAPHELTNIDPTNATLQDLRYFAGLSVSSVAAELSVTNDQIHKFEAGERKPTAEAIETLARLYRVTPTELTDSLKRHNSNETNAA
jgi:transcriptional regulator with XRE-family HTH domain